MIKLKRLKAITPSEIDSFAPSAWRPFAHIALRMWKLTVTYLTFRRVDQYVHVNMRNIYVRFS